MRSFLFLLLVTLIQLPSFLAAQVMSPQLSIGIQGGCSGVNIDLSGFGSQFFYVAQADGGPHLVDPSTSSTNPSCNRFVLNPTVGRIRTQFQLQKLNSSNEWENVGGLVTSTNFGTLSKGTYRVRSPGPVALFNSSSSNACPISAVNSFGQNIGQIGALPAAREEANLQLVTSTAVIVGSTSQDDIDAQVTNEFGTPKVNFDDNDEVNLDLSNCTNFNRYYIAISQYGSNNYQSNGWKDGTPTSINLNDIWSKGVNWRFWTGNRFRVQVVLDNTDCRNGIWNQKFYDFDTCPNGFNTCRFDLSEKVSILPNPAQDRVVIQNIRVDPSINHMLTITSISGQTIRRERLSGSVVDVSTLKSGVYILRVDNDNESLLTTKLVKQ